MNLMSKNIESKVVDLTNAVLDAIAHCIEAREYPEALAATSVLTSLVTIDCFRPIIEDAIDDEDVKEDETGVDDNPLHDEAIKRGLYSEYEHARRDLVLGLFARGDRAMWATSFAQAARLLPGAGEVDFLNTKIPRAFSVTNGESAAITVANPTPPEHQRYVGPLLPDGSVPQS